MSSPVSPSKDRYITIEDKKFHKFIIPKEIVKNLASVFKQAKYGHSKYGETEIQGYYLTLHMRDGSTIKLNPVDRDTSCDMVENERFDNPTYDSVDVFFSIDSYKNVKGRVKELPVEYLPEGLPNGYYQK